MGDFSGNDKPTQSQIDATLGLLLYLDAAYGIDDVAGHYEYPGQDNTVCPGANMIEPIEMFKDYIE